MGIHDLIVKWSIRGIARTQLRAFKLTQKKNVDASEADIAPLLFERRMRVLGSSAEQQAMISYYFKVNSPITTLREACHAIAVVEHKISPLDEENVRFLTEIIDKELEKRGYI